MEYPKLSIDDFRLEMTKFSASVLNLDKLKELRSWVGQRIKAEEQRLRDDSQGPVDSIEEKKVGDKTYRREPVRCGKRGCKCAEGSRHGPYWYAYWKEGGRTRKKYIGKILDSEMTHTENEE